MVLMPSPQNYNDCSVQSKLEAGQLICTYNCRDTSTLPISALLATLHSGAPQWQQGPSAVSAGFHGPCHNQLPQDKVLANCVLQATAMPVPSSSHCWQDRISLVLWEAAVDYESSFQNCFCSSPNNTPCSQNALEGFWGTRTFHRSSKTSQE